MISFARMVTNSALASGLAAGMALRSVSISRVQHEPHLIGRRAVTGGAIGGQLHLMRLDQVLGLAAFAIDRLIKMLRLAGQRGDDVADIESQRCCLKPGHHLARLVPALGPIA